MVYREFDIKQIDNFDFFLYGSWEPLDMRKILVQALGTFSTPGQPIPRNFQKSCLFNFSGLSTENLYMCPVSTLAGRFFSKKKVALQKTTYSRLERLLASKWPPPGIKTEHFHWKGVQKLRSLEHASGTSGTSGTTGNEPQPSFRATHPHAPGAKMTVVYTNSLKL